MRLKTKIKRNLKKPQTITLLLAILIGIGGIAYQHFSLASEVASGSYVEINYKKTVKDFCSLPYVDCNPQEIEMKEWIYNRWLKNTDQKTALEAMKIIKCESHFNPDVVIVEPNGTYSCGLFQINSVHIPEKLSNSQCLDWQYNTDTAIKIYLEQGWTPWSCARRLGIR